MHGGILHELLFVEKAKIQRVIPAAAVFLAACVPQPPTPSTTAAASSTAIIPAAGSPIGADGRFGTSFDGGRLRVEPAPGFAECLVLVRLGAQRPWNLQGAEVGMGGNCPNIYWRGSVTDLNAFRNGIVMIEGRGRCEVPQGTQAFGTLGNCL
ncbi:MAG: hypothetical protein NTZ22_11125 [Hyphomicrobiales bacterium]|nr:hypothetical protein [Hyphomicrobiales bacterium]